MANSVSMLGNSAEFSLEPGSPSSLETKHDNDTASNNSDKTPFILPEQPNLREPRDLIDMVSQSVHSTSGIA